MAEVSLWLKSPYGILQTPSLVFTEADWTLDENHFGVLRASGPLAEVNPAFFMQDARIEVKRSIDGGAPYVEGKAPFLLRYWDIGDEEDGSETYNIEAYTPEYILTGHTIDSYASTETVTNALTTKTGAADDLAKAWVRENITAASLAIRNVTGLTVEADTTKGATTTVSCSYDKLWDVLLDLAEDSANSGTYLSYAIEYSGSDGGLIFRTFTGQRGVAHTGRGAIIAAKELGNLRMARTAYDYRTAVTAVRAGGKGQGAARLTVRLEDTERSSASPYAYREDFEDNSRAETEDALTAIARTALEKGRATRAFTGSFIDTDYARYGREVNFGDTLIAKHRGESFTCRLSRVHGNYTKEGGEILEIDLKGTEAI